MSMFGTIWHRLAPDKVAVLARSGTSVTLDAVTVVPSPTPTDDCRRWCVARDMHDS